MVKMAASVSFRKLPMKVSKCTKGKQKSYPTFLNDRNMFWLLISTICFESGFLIWLGHLRVSRTQSLSPCHISSISQGEYCHGILIFATVMYYHTLFVLTAYIDLCKIPIELDRTSFLSWPWKRCVMLKTSLLWVFWQALFCINCRKDEGEGASGCHGHAGPRSYENKRWHELVSWGMVHHSFQSFSAILLSGLGLVDFCPGTSVSFIILSQYNNTFLLSRCFRSQPVVVRTDESNLQLVWWSLDSMPRRFECHICDVREWTTSYYPDRT